MPDVACELTRRRAIENYARYGYAGGGKSGSHRTLLSARIGRRYVFLYGFSKSGKENITQNERKALQFAGKVFLELSAEALLKAKQAGILQGGPL